MKSIACSCGGQNPNCFRCSGSGFFKGEASESTGLHPRYRQAHPDEPTHRKFKGRDAPPGPDPVVDARAKELVEAANARTAQENATRREDARKRRQAQTQSALGIRERGFYRRLPSLSWGMMGEAARQGWRQIPIDEMAQGARQDVKTAPAGTLPGDSTSSIDSGISGIEPRAMDPVESGEPLEQVPPPNPMYPGEPQPSPEVTRAFRCPECLRRFRELIPLDAHILSEHGRRAHAHYWEDAYRRHHGIEPRPEITNRTNTGVHKPPAARLPAQPGDAVFNRVLSHFSAATPVVIGGEIPRMADGGRDGSYGGGGSFRDFAKSCQGAEFGSYPEFDAMDDESAA